MASKILSESVSSTDDGTTWDFQCPGVVGSRSCPPGEGGWSSTGWPTKTVALARGQEHFDEHKSGVAASSTGDFRDKHGLGVNPDTGLAVKVEDL